MKPVRLDHILEVVYAHPWAILPSSHKAIQQLIEAKLNGMAFPDFEDPDEEDKDFQYEAHGVTAIIPIVGTILNKTSGLEAMCGGFSCQTFRQNLRAAAADEKIKNIVLNISSGGGTITGVPETADLIAKVAAQKPVYAYTDDCIASAAFWLSSQTNGIFLSKSAQVGSIGVYMALLDSSVAFAQNGVKVELFKAGKFKGMGIPGTTLSDEQRALLQASVDKNYALFVSYVTAGRRKVTDDSMQGQMFDANDAIKNGLADGIINDLDDLLEYLNPDA